MVSQAFPFIPTPTLSAEVVLSLIISSFRNFINPGFLDFLMKSLKELLESGIVKPAKLPEMNDFDPGDLDRLSGYTVPLVAHDYGAKTPIMWNTLYREKGMNLRNIMVVANPGSAREIFEALKQDPKYLGGGAGVGFKEESIKYLDRVYPEDLKAVNIIVKEDGDLVGYNTDAEGFVRSLEETMGKVGKDVRGSNFVVYGAGGVAKEVTKLLAERKANHIRIVNRTFSKAVALAHDLNEKYGQVAIGLGEDMSRGSLLNSDLPVDALINTTDKGSDGALENIAMYSGNHEFNETISRTILRELVLLRPNVVVADIVLPKSGKSVSLRLAEAAGISNLLDGRPMVVYQAVPAYKMIEMRHPDAHGINVEESEVLDIFKKAANLTTNGNLTKSR